MSLRVLQRAEAYYKPFTKFQLTLFRDSQHPCIDFDNERASLFCINNETQ